MVKEIKIDNHTLKYPDVLWYLVQNAKERVENKLDNVIIITGKVGSGKSNLALGLGILYEYMFNRKLTLDNVHFLIEEVLQELYKHDNKTLTIIHDEAISGSSSRDVTSNFGKLLLRALITKRFKSHFLILNIDNIKELNKKVIERSVAWIHTSYVRTPKGYVKGLFKIFGPKKAEKIYLDVKGGRFLNVETHPLYKQNTYLFKCYKYFDTIINEDEYEEKKSKYTSNDQEQLGIKSDEKSIDSKLFNKYLLSAPILLLAVMDKFKITKADIFRNLNMNWHDIGRIVQEQSYNIIKNYEDKIVLDKKILKHIKTKKLKLIE